MVTLLAVIACTRITDAELDAKLGVSDPDAWVEDTGPLNAEDLPPETVQATLVGRIGMDVETSAGPYTCEGAASFPHDGRRFVGTGDCELAVEGQGSGVRLGLRWFGTLDETIVRRATFEVRVTGAACATVTGADVDGKLAVDSQVDFSGDVDTAACPDLGGAFGASGTVEFYAAQ